MGPSDQCPALSPVDMVASCSLGVRDKHLLTECDSFTHSACRPLVYPPGWWGCVKVKGDINRDRDHFLRMWGFQPRLQEKTGLVGR